MRLLFNRFAHSAGLTEGGTSVCFVFVFSYPLWTLSDPRRLPWGSFRTLFRFPYGSFRTLEGSLGNPFGPRRLPWGPFRALEGSLGDPFGPRRLPWGTFRALEGSLEDPFGLSKAPWGKRRSLNGASGRRQGDVEGPIFAACSPRGRGGEAT